jgi:MerR family transcriptional regulator, redox-sensitive transcriptional activator SoxR
VSEAQPWLTIGEVARRAGVKASTVRYYESLGVLPEPERVSGRRRYTDDVLRRLAIVDAAQRAGCSLEEIRDLLSAEPAFERIRALAAHKLPEIERLIEHALAVHRWLEAATACECETLDVCALFDDRAVELRDRERRPVGRGALGATQSS